MITSPVAASSTSRLFESTFATRMIALNAVSSPLPAVQNKAIAHNLHLNPESDFDNTHTFHIDLWTGSNTQGGGSKQIECENKLPGGQLTIINNPPSGLEVDSMSTHPTVSHFCILFWPDDAPQLYLSSISLAIPAPARLTPCLMDQVSAMEAVRAIVAATVILLHLHPRPWAQHH